MPFHKNIAIVVVLGLAILTGCTTADEATDDFIESEIANLKKLKEFFHDKTNDEAMALIDKDGSGGISKVEIDSLADMLGLQHVNPSKKASAALWNALAGEDGEIQLEELEATAQGPSERVIGL